MSLFEDLLAGKTFAESLGITSEMGRTVAALATRELDQGRLEVARDLAEGLALTNPHDPAVWCLLALVERRAARPLAASFCAGIAIRLAPEDPQVRLVGAEVGLGVPGTRPGALDALRALAELDGHVGDRARALLAALGDPSLATPPAAGVAAASGALAPPA